MLKLGSIATLASAAVLALSTSATADFSGQIILGPLGPGDSVNGDTTGAADDNDGWTSGTHDFGFWEGPDDAWQIDWPGGDMQIELNYVVGNGDLDVFLFEPGSYNDSSNYGIQNDGDELIFVAAAPAGTYYVNIDGVSDFVGSGDAGPYTLSVSLVPEPGTVSLLAFGLVAILRRNRK